MIEIIAYVVIAYVFVRFAEIIANAATHEFVRVLAAIGALVALVGALLVFSNGRTMRDTLGGVPTPTFDYSDTSAVIYP